MPKQPITSESMVRAVLDASPAAVSVFVRRRMHCAGCFMAPFMTLAEAATSHGTDVAGLVDDLRDACAVAEGAG